jgi:flagellar FliL protein
MAEKKAPEGEAGAEGAEGAPGKKKLAGKQLILFIVAPAVLLLGGGGAAAYFLVFAKPPAAAEGEAGKGEDKAKDKKDDKKKDDKKKDEKGGEKKEGEEGQQAVVSEGPNGEGFLTLPDMLVNISTGTDRVAYLKLRVTLQMADSEVAAAVEAAAPRLRDQFTGFLRELRMEDVAGAAGYTRLQLELLKRANLAVAPAKIDAVLIEELLVQ